MKFDFKFLLVGIFVPTMALTLVPSVKLQEPSQAVIAVERPYIVEVLSTKGVSVGEFRGVSSSLDPMEIAQSLGASVDPKDKFTTFPDIRMGIGSKITVYQAPAITVVDGKKSTIIRSWQENIADLFTENNIEIGDDDKVNFPLDTEIIDKMQIKIIRVAITQVHETQMIQFNIVKKNDNTLDKGKTRIDQKGVLGVRTLTYQVRREDGIQISKTLQRSEVTIPAVDEIQIIGTKPVITGWCKYNDLVLDASIKNGLDPDKLCNLMKIESWGHADSVGQGGAHLGLFQYDPGFWADVSRRAGYAGADIFDAKAQIYTTAWALTHGYSGRW